jgi:hypothetical protein
MEWETLKKENTKESRIERNANRAGKATKLTIREEHSREVHRPRNSRVQRLESIAECLKIGLDFLGVLVCRSVIVICGRIQTEAGRGRIILEFGE